MKARGLVIGAFDSSRLAHYDEEGKEQQVRTSPQAMLQSSATTGSFASIEERVAHLNWCKMCNGRQIQETLRRSKQMQERDEFLRAATKHNGRAQREWMHGVIAQELLKPLPVSEHTFHEMTQQQAADERRIQDATKRHITQIRSIQAKLDAREAEVERKRVFERKKKELLGSSGRTGGDSTRG